MRNDSGWSILFIADLFFSSLSNVEPAGSDPICPCLLFRPRPDLILLRPESSDEFLFSRCSSVISYCFSYRAEIRNYGLSLASKGFGLWSLPFFLNRGIIGLCLGDAIPEIVAISSPLWIINFSLL